MKTLLEKIRDINHIVQDATGHSISFTEMAETLQENLEANVYILNSEGKILGNCFIDNFDCPTMKDIVKFEGLYPEADRWILSSPQITSSIGIYSVVITHLYVRLRLRYMIRQRGRIFL